jgi:hypothetical protein
MKILEDIKVMGIVVGVAATSYFMIFTFFREEIMYVVNSIKYHFGG